MSQLSHFLEFLFPERCIGCATRGAPICAHCFSKLPPAEAPKQPFITSLFAYRDSRVNHLVWRLKYKNGKRIAKIFAEALAGSLAEFLGEELSFIGSRKILLVPIPMTPRRQRRRGYNQAELLAREVHTFFQEENIFLDTKLLEKKIDTTPQAKIKNKAERLLNLKDCFSVRFDGKGNGEVIILIDDVTTTGATLVAAKNALRDAGYRKIYALTIAH
ncbi:MAG: ComF family protein [Candidatus Pacebacteria bacterium]|nr:ComF family protein [Candidatus Paceibacterota bacterium]